MDSTLTVKNSNVMNAEPQFQTVSDAILKDLSVLSVILDLESKMLISLAGNLTVRLSDLPMNAPHANKDIISKKAQVSVLKTALSSTLTLKTTSRTSFAERDAMKAGTTTLIKLTSVLNASMMGL